MQNPLPPSYQMRNFDDDLPVSGIDTFAHLNWTNCFAPESNGTFDIAIVGAPFDLGVSYRPGARFGPTGARMGARNMSPSWGWELVEFSYFP
jgi:agmatinase